MKISLPVKLGIFVILLFAVMTSGCNISEKVHSETAGAAKEITDVEKKAPPEKCCCELDEDEFIEKYLPKIALRCRDEEHLKWMPFVCDDFLTYKFEDSFDIELDENTFLVGDYMMVHSTHWDKEKV